MKKSSIIALLVISMLYVVVLNQWDLQDYGVIISNEHRAKYLWGTYKPNLYFAMKNRKNSSHVFGLMWYGADKKENYFKYGNVTDRIRHDCNMNNGLKYHWMAHNGEDYGQQHIHDEANELRLETTFVKRDSSSEKNQTWEAIIKGSKLHRYYDKTQEKISQENYNSRKENKTIALVLYTSLENFHVEDKSFFSSLDIGNVDLVKEDLEDEEENPSPHRKENSNTEEDGKDKNKKNLEFTIAQTTKSDTVSYLKYSIPKNAVINYSVQKYRKKFEDTWRVKKFISEELKNQELELSSGLDFALFSQTKPLKSPNIIAVQLLLKAPFKIRTTYSTVKENISNVSKKRLNKFLQAKLTRVNLRYDNVIVPKYTTLDIIKKRDPNDIYRLKSMMKEAIANVVGGIGYYWGKIKIQFDDKPEKGRYIQGFRYALEDKGLLSASPSRSFFARGFLWDEGFHNIIISQFNYNITIDIIDSWLSTMSATGYIAREQIRGAEQEAQVGSQFVVQDKLIANPPTFIFPVTSIINFYKYQSEEKDLRLVHNFLKKVYDKFSSWYEWYEFYQKSSSGDRQSASSNMFYSWQGRNSEHNLASGLDDFPRGLTPNIYEKHLDLYVWVMELIRCLRDLGEIFDYEMVSHFDAKLKTMKDNLKSFKDEKLGILNDQLGPQFKLTESKKFKRPVFPINWRGDNKCGDPIKHATNPIGADFTDCNPYSKNNCCSEFGWCGSGPQFCDCPKCKKSIKLEDRGITKENISNPHIGYVTLFPLMFGYLETESEEFYNLLRILQAEDELNSPYGIRSLSKSDLLYHTGDDYWRGNIWMNLNYLTLRGLYVYYKKNTEAMELYNSLRNKIVNTVYTEWKKTGMFYEQYSDIDGKGLKATPFNGWTSLIVNIMTESYDVEIY